MDAPTGQSLHTWTVVVRGRVQGVNYRRFTAAQAELLGVRGWVRNDPDSGVRALLQHEDRALLERMLALLRQGPPLARVDGIEVEVLPEAARCEGFTVLH